MSTYTAVSEDYVRYDQERRAFNSSLITHLLKGHQGSQLLVTDTSRNAMGIVSKRFNRDDTWEYSNILRDSETVKMNLFDLLLDIIENKVNGKTIKFKWIGWRISGEVGSGNYFYKPMYYASTWTPVQVQKIIHDFRLLRNDPISPEECDQLPSRIDYLQQRLLDQGMEKSIELDMIQLFLDRTMAKPSFRLEKMHPYQNKLLEQKKQDIALED